jgi:hypothetical protein
MYLGLVLSREAPKMAFLQPKKPNFPPFSAQERLKNG